LRFKISLSTPAYRMINYIIENIILREVKRPKNEGCPVIALKGKYIYTTIVNALLD